MSQFDIKMTELADSIKGKNPEVSGKLSIQGMIDAVDAISVGTDVSGVTATAADVLNTVKFVDITGTLQSGSIATVTPSLDENVFTVSKGYVSENTTMEVPEVTITNDGETATVSVGYVKTPQQFNLGGGGVVLPDGITVAPENVLNGVYYVDADGAKQVGTMANHGVAEVELQEIPHSLPSGYYERIDIPAAPEGGGTGSSDVVYGYLDDSGKFQALDLTADTPVDSGTAEDFVELIMYQTGRDEPGYTSEGGTGGEGMAAFYECASVASDSWSGYKMVYSDDEAETPAGWTKTDELIEGLEIKGYTPRIGTIYNSDATIEVKRAFDGTVWDYIVNMPLDAKYDTADTGQGITEVGSPEYTINAGVQCLKLNGSSGLVITDSGIDLSGDLTICFKVYYDNLNDGVLFHLGTSSNNDLLIMNSGSSSWVVGTAAGSGDIYVNTDITTGKWYNIALKRESGRLVFYQDGVLMHSEDWGITLISSGKLRIGHGFHNGNDTWFFTGYLAKFMLFNRALSDDDITKVFV